MTSSNDGRCETGKRLREARTMAGLSQGQVAKMMNMHRPTVSEIEAGRRRVSTEEIKAFAKIYSVNADWLISGSENSGDKERKILMAARELSSMTEEDLDKLMSTIKMIRGAENR